MNTTLLSILFIFTSALATADIREEIVLDCNGNGYMSQTNDPLDEIIIDFKIRILERDFGNGQFRIFQVGGHYSYLNGWKKGSGASWGMVNTDGIFNDQSLEVTGYMYHAEKKDFLLGKYSDDTKMYVGTYLNELYGHHFTFSCRVE